jgi:hypothetical protein
MYKFINKYNIERADKTKILKYDNKQVINPKNENFIEAGYKILEIEEEPNFNIDTQYLQHYYVEKEDKIIQKFEIKDIEEG